MNVGWNVNAPPRRLPSPHAQRHITAALAVRPRKNLRIVRVAVVARIVRVTVLVRRRLRELRVVVHVLVVRIGAAIPARALIATVVVSLDCRTHRADGFVIRRGWRLRWPNVHLHAVERQAERAVSTSRTHDTRTTQMTTHTHTQPR